MRDDATGIERAARSESAGEEADEIARLAASTSLAQRADEADGGPAAGRATAGTGEPISHSELKEIENHRVGEREAAQGFERYSASLIVVTGSGRGEEHLVERADWLVGRGPGVDAAFDDPEMSQRHLRIEFSRGRFRAVDLDSTNGTRVNGVGVAVAELAHGDRIHAGAHVFQILIERREVRSWPDWSARGDVVPRVQ